MLYKVYTWNAHAINDGSNYNAWLTNFYPQAEVTVVEGKRTLRSPVMLGKEPLSKVFYLVIDPKGTVHTQWAELSKWFDHRDTTLYKLVIKDEADSNRQWYVYCTPKKNPKMDMKDGVVYEMHCLDPIWRTVTENSDVWNITASGQTNDLILLGNRYSHPKFRIKPTAMKTSGSLYRMFRVWRNPNGTGASRRLQDVVGHPNESISNQINNGGGYSSSATSLAIDTSVGGGLSTGAGVCYNTRTKELMKYSGISVGTMTVTTRGYGQTVAAAINNDDVLQQYGWNTKALINDTTVSNQVNNGAGYTSAAVSIAIDIPVGGGLRTTGGMCYVARTGEQIKYDSIAADVMTVNASGRGYAGTTAAALLDNDVLSFSHLAADGRDVRVYVNAVSLPRWLRNFNTTYSSIFVNMDWEAKITFTLLDNIASSGSITHIQLRAEDVIAMRLLQAKSNLAVAIGSEVFTFTEFNLPQAQLGGTVTRAAYGSSMAAHTGGPTGGDTVTWIQHRIEIAYGNAAASAPTQDESGAPLQDLDTATNFGWKFLLFRDRTGLRAGQWTLDTMRGQGSRVYFGTHDSDADPATELGLIGAAFNSGGRINADTYEIAMSFYDFAGFIGGTPVGDKRRESTDWATVAGMRKSQNGVAWNNIFTEATPASEDTWTAWSNNNTYASYGGTYPYVQVYHKGNVKGVAGNMHSFELQTYSGYLQPTGIPQLVLAGSEIANNYDLDCEILNDDLDLRIHVKGPLALDETIEVDTYRKTIKRLSDNSDAFPFLQDDSVVRGEWLPNDPTEGHLSGSDTVNTYQYIEADAVGVTVTTLWEDCFA